jgi:hypothetical protein
MKPTALLLLLLAVGCGGGPPPPPSQQPIAAVTLEERLYYDNSGAYPDSVRLVIRDPETFRQAWEQATRDQASPPPPPAVDFDESMVLLVAAGLMTPEDRIRVDSVGVRSVPRTDGGREDVLTVVVGTVRGCGRLSVDAYPVEIVRIPRFEGRIEFVEQSRRDCPGGGTRWSTAARAAWPSPGTVAGTARPEPGPTLSPEPRGGGDGG